MEPLPPPYFRPRSAAFVGPSVLPVSVVLGSSSIAVVSEDAWFPSHVVFSSEVDLQKAGMRQGYPNHSRFLLVRFPSP